MSPEHTYPQLMKTGLYLLFIFSMVIITDAELLGFPIYSLLLFVMALCFLAGRILSCENEGIAFLQIRSWTDVAAIAAIIFAVFTAVLKLFRDPNEGAVDFASDADVIALAVMYLLFSSGIRFKQIYFDLILYGGLLMAGIVFSNFMNEEMLSPYIPILSIMAIMAIMLLDHIDGKLFKRTYLNNLEIWRKCRRIFDSICDRLCIQFFVSQY